MLQIHFFLQIFENFRKNCLFAKKGIPKSSTPVALSLRTQKKMKNESTEFFLVWIWRNNLYVFSLAGTCLPLLTLVYLYWYVFAPTGTCLPLLVRVCTHWHLFALLTLARTYWHFLSLLVGAKMRLITL